MDKIWHKRDNEKVHFQMGINKDTKETDKRQITVTSRKVASFNTKTAFKALY